MSSSAGSAYSISLHMSDGAGGDETFGTMAVSVGGAVTEAFVLALTAALNNTTGGPTGFNARVTRTDSTTFNGDLAANPPAFS